MNKNKGLLPKALSENNRTDERGYPEGMSISPPVKPGQYHGLHHHYIAQTTCTQGYNSSGIANSYCYHTYSYWSSEYSNSKNKTDCIDWYNSRIKTVYFMKNSVNISNTLPRLETYFNFPKNTPKFNDLNIIRNIHEYFAEREGVCLKDQDTGYVYMLFNRQNNIYLQREESSEVLSKSEIYDEFILRNDPNETELKYYKIYIKNGDLKKDDVTDEYINRKLDTEKILVPSYDNYQAKRLGVYYIYYKESNNSFLFEQCVSDRNFKSFYYDLNSNNYLLENIDTDDNTKFEDIVYQYTYYEDDKFNRYCSKMYISSGMISNSSYNTYAGFKMYEDYHLFKDIKIYRDDKTCEYKLELYVYVIRSDGRIIAIRKLNDYDSVEYVRFFDEKLKKFSHIFRIGNINFFDQKYINASDYMDEFIDHSSEDDRTDYFIVFAHHKLFTDKIMSFIRYNEYIECNYFNSKTINSSKNDLEYNFFSKSPYETFKKQQLSQYSDKIFTYNVEEQFSLVMLDPIDITVLAKQNYLTLQDSNDKESLNCRKRYKNVSYFSWGCIGYRERISYDEYIYTFFIDETDIDDTQEGLTHFVKFRTKNKDLHKRIFAEVFQTGKIKDKRIKTILLNNALRAAILYNYFDTINTSEIELIIFNRPIDLTGLYQYYVSNSRRLTTQSKDDLIKADYVNLNDLGSEYFFDNQKNRYLVKFTDYLPVIQYSTISSGLALSYYEDEDDSILGRVIDDRIYNKITTSLMNRSFSNNRELKEYLVEINGFDTLSELIYTDFYMGEKCIGVHGNTNTGNIEVSYNSPRGYYDVLRDNSKNKPNETEIKQTQYIGNDTTIVYRYNPYQQCYNSKNTDDILSPDCDINRYSIVGQYGSKDRTIFPIFNYITINSVRVSESVVLYPCIIQQHIGFSLYEVQSSYMFYELADTSPTTEGINNIKSINLKSRNIFENQSVNKLFYDIGLYFTDNSKDNFNFNLDEFVTEYQNNFEESEKYFICKKIYKKYIDLDGSTKYHLIVYPTDLNQNLTNKMLKVVTPRYLFLKRTKSYDRYIYEYDKCLINEQVVDLQLLKYFENDSFYDGSFLLQNIVHTLVNMNEHISLKFNFYYLDSPAIKKNEMFQNKLCQNNKFRIYFRKNLLEHKGSYKKPHDKIRTLFDKYLIE